MKALLWTEPDGKRHVLIDTLTPERVDERYRMLARHFPESGVRLVDVDMGSIPWYPKA